MNAMKSPVNSSEIAKQMHRRTIPAMRLMAIFFAFAISASAQQAEGDAPKAPQNPEPPPPPPRHGGPHHGPHGGDMMSGRGGRPRGFDGLDQLSEKEREKVRAAFSKAWQRPEVIAARDKAAKAGEEVREKLHIAVREIDPEVAKILEKVRPPFPMDHRGLPELPKPDSPEFGRMAGIRLGAEVMSMSRPERREETRRFHERIMQLPSVKDGLAELDRLPPNQRMAAFQHLREVYRQVAGDEIKKLRKKFDGQGEDGFRRPPPPPEGPPEEASKN